MYTLRYPFELSPGLEISGVPYRTRIGNLTVSLEREDAQYTLSLTGFDNKASATAFFANLHVGLKWLLLKRGLPSYGDSELREPTYSKDPAKSAEIWREQYGLDKGKELHGLIDGDRPAIFESDKTFSKIAMGKAQLRQITPADTVLNLLSEGAQFANPAGALEDSRLFTALDLYGAFFAEASQRARFLTLIMALEALAESQLRPKLILDLLERF
jgi:hypothetical protein